MYGAENASKYGASENPNVPEVNLWTVEGLALFNKEYSPQVRNVGERNFINLSKLVKLLSSPNYQLPSANNIPQEEALQIAKAAVKEQLGWSDELLALYTKPAISYRIEYMRENDFNNEFPTHEWYIGFRLFRPNDDAAQAELDSRVIAREIPGGAMVLISAQTSDVIQIQQWNGYWEYQKYGEFYYDENEPDGNG
jgi:hypothetical protein